MNKTQQLYIANWHDSFVQYIQQIQSFIVALETLPEATDEDKKAFDVIKMMLNGKDVQDVERDLASGTIKRSTFEKIAKFDKDLMEETVDHINTTHIHKFFLKELSHQRVDQNKELDLMMLNMLQKKLLRKELLLQNQN